jgi:4-hydroxy-4-methyl-2-oxoglutarate aldolase
MIEDPPLLTVRNNFERPTAADVAALRGAATGHLVDALGGGGALDRRIKPVTRAAPAEQVFCGVAVTCDCGPADNLAVFGALEATRPGDVIVAATDAYMGCALIGDLVLGMARNCGAVAFVTDGLARDLDGLEAVGIPVFCRGISPNSPARNGPGKVGLPVNLGTVTVESGDVVVGDRDGVVVVPRARIAEVVEALVRIREAEAGLEAKVDGGLKVPDFIADLLASDRVRRLD